MELNDIVVCRKCGILMDKTIALEYKSEQYYPGWYEGKCPSCGNKICEDE